MSRAFKRLKDFHPSWVLKNLIEPRLNVFHTQKENPGRLADDVPLFSWLSSGRNSKPLYSSHSTWLSKGLCSKPAESDTTGNSKKNGDVSKDKTPNASTTTKRKDIHESRSDNVNQIKEDEKSSRTTTESSASVEDDIKKQIKRLSDILHNFSTSEGNRDAFSFKNRVFGQTNSTADELNWWMDPFKIVERIYNWFYGQIIYNYMEKDFDVHDFLEGSKDAFYMVNSLFEEGDFETLKPMISTKLYNNMKATSEQFQKEGLSFAMSPENIIGVYIAGLKIVQSKALISFGPEFDVPEDANGKTNFWFLIYVRFARNEHYRLTRAATGEVMQDSMNRRRDLWTFVRGPVNELPIKEDRPGWTLLSIA